MYYRKKEYISAKISPGNSISVYLRFILVESCIAIACVIARTSVIKGYYHRFDNAVIASLLHWALQCCYCIATTLSAVIPLLYRHYTERCNAVIVSPLHWAMQTLTNSIVSATLLFSVANSCQFPTDLWVFSKHVWAFMKSNFGMKICGTFVGIL